MQLFLNASLPEFFLCRIMTGDVCVMCKMTRKLDKSVSMHCIPVEKKCEGTLDLIASPCREGY